MGDEIDAGWKIMKFGDVLAHRKERARPGDPLLSVTSDRGVVPQAQSGRRDVSSTNKYSYWRAYPGDIIYNTMRMWQGVSARSDYFGIVSPAYTVCSPQEGVDSNFLAYALKLPEHILAFKNRSQGLVSDTWNLKYRSFAALPINIPSHPEQRRIAEVLDAADEEIRSTERLITKLEQTKQGLLAALLNQKYHRGVLDDYIVFGPQNGLYKPFSAYHSGGSPIVRIDSFDEGVLHSLTRLRRLSVTPSEVRLYGLTADDIIVNRVNSVDLVGKCAIVPALYEPTVFESNIMRLKVDAARLRPPFAVLWLSSHEAQAHFRRNAKSAISQASINQTDVRNCTIMVPPIEEQEAILIAAEGAEERIVTTTREVQKLRVLKRGLMDDLLKGRVRMGASA